MSEKNIKKEEFVEGQNNNNDNIHNDTQNEQNTENENNDNTSDFDGDKEMTESVVDSQNRNSFFRGNNENNNNNENNENTHLKIENTENNNQNNNNSNNNNNMGDIHSERRDVHSQNLTFSMQIVGHVNSAVSLHETQSYPRHRNS